MEIYLTIAIFILGTIFGSFYNVCIYRIPEKISVATPPSHCYNCDTRLSPLDLIPVLSWMLLRGKCRYCGQKISPRYAIIELLTGILFVLTYLTFGYKIDTIYYLVLVSLLIIITFIDIDHYIIPDGLIIIGSIFAIIFNFIYPIVGIRNSIISGIICGLGTLAVISLIEFITKKEVMGGGDIKLFGMLGLFVGLKLGVLTILLSVYVGAAYGIVTIIYSKINKKEYNSMIPYGPFISIAAIISLTKGESIINWYLSLFI